MNLFGHVKEQQCLYRHVNFYDFPTVMLMLARMSTGENWRARSPPLGRKASPLHPQHERPELRGPSAAAAALRSLSLPVACAHTLRPGRWLHLPVSTCPASLSAVPQRRLLPTGRL